MLLYLCCSRKEFASPSLDLSCFSLFLMLIRIRSKKGSSSSPTKRCIWVYKFVGSSFMSWKSIIFFADDERCWWRWWLRWSSHLISVWVKRKTWEEDRVSETRLVCITYLSFLILLVVNPFPYLFLPFLSLVFILHILVRWRDIRLRIKDRHR